MCLKFGYRVHVDVVRKKNLNLNFIFVKSCPSDDGKLILLENGNIDVIGDELTWFFVFKSVEWKSWKE